jgi:hypothetical protein
MNQDGSALLGARLARRWSRRRLHLRAGGRVLVHLSATYAAERCAHFLLALHDIQQKYDALAAVHRKEYRVHLGKWPLCYAHLLTRLERCLGKWGGLTLVKLCDKFCGYGLRLAAETDDARHTTGGA